jgi:hypothetical protein
MSVLSGKEFLGMDSSFAPIIGGQHWIMPIEKAPFI